MQLWLVYECEAWEAPRIIGIYTDEPAAEARKIEAEILAKKYIPFVARRTLTYRISQGALNVPFRCEGEYLQDLICLETNPNGTTPHALLGSTCGVCGHTVKSLSF